MHGPPASVLSGPRRVLVASPMKAASTYTAHVIARYLGVSVPDVEYDWLAEQNYTDALRRQLAGGPFVMSLHMRPHQSNLNGLHADDVRVTLLWRNLGDVIVSFDDHVPRYGAHNPMFFVDHDRFVRLPRQERFRHAIDGFVPWNLGFYLHWRLMPGLPFNPYELLVADAPAFFRQLLTQIGVAVEPEWLDEVLAQPADGTRFNVGSVGRSALAFDDETKRRVERRVLEHPERDELDVLVWELPWAPCELMRVTAYDGTVIAADASAPYYVSRGVRHAVSPRWLASRGAAALRTPRAAEAGVLDAIPLGAPYD